MNKAAQDTSIKQSPLYETHARLGAEFSEREGWLLPACYGDLLREYASVRERGAGLIDLSARGRIKVSGAEAVQFLNGLITNDVKQLDENQWMPAVFPNVQGRLIAAVRVMRLSDEETQKGPNPVFLLDTAPVNRDTVLKIVERFALAGDFRVSDITDKTALISLQGKKAVEILAHLFGNHVTGVSFDGVLTLGWNGTNVGLVHASHTGEDGFDLLIDSTRVTDLWNTILQESAWPVGFEALEILRIEAGIPRHGIDIDETLVVSETNLEEAVSYTKGCYIGQEIIARIKYRGHVAKKLTGLVFEKATKIEHGAEIKSDDDKDVGRVTSATYSPHLGRTIAMAMVKYQYLPANTKVTLRPGEDYVEAQVSELPFVEGSWLKQKQNYGGRT